MNAFSRQLLLVWHLSLQSIKGVQQPNRERRTGTHTTSGRQISVMMDFHSSADFRVAQHFPNRRMCNFVDGLTILDLRIDQSDSMTEKRRQITAAKIAILVNR